MTQTSAIAASALAGFADASSYDRFRPSYPPEAVDRFLHGLNISGHKGAKVVDLAAGTGKFTEALAQRAEGYEILAIEPHDGMRWELERKELPSVRTMNGTAAVIPLESQSVDCVIAAQSFHWFATQESLQEIHRVIRPGGAFGVIWNIEDYNAPLSWTPTTVWEYKVRTLMWSFDDNNPRFRNDKWRDVFDQQLKTTPPTTQTAGPLFSLPLGEGSFQFTKWLSKEAVWDRFHTLSQIAVLEGEDLESAKEVFFNAINEDDVEVNERGEVELHGQTFFAWTRAITSAPVQ